MEAIYTVLDFETTGLSAAKDRVIDLALVQLDSSHNVVNEFSTLVNPGVPLPPVITRITGLKDIDFVKSRAPFMEDVLNNVADLIHGTTLIAHNARFDESFLLSECERTGVEPPGYVLVDTLALAKGLRLPVTNHKLGTLLDHFGIVPEGSHRALHDARATAELFKRLRSL